MERVPQRVARVIRVIRDKNHSLDRLGMVLRFREKQDSTGGIAHQSARHITKKWTQHHLLFQGAGDNKIDIVFTGGLQDRVRRSALPIMNRRIVRQMQLLEYIAEFL